MTAPLKPSEAAQLIRDELEELRRNATYPLDNSSELDDARAWLDAQCIARGETLVIPNRPVAWRCARMTGGYTYETERPDNQHAPWEPLYAREPEQEKGNG